MVYMISLPGGWIADRLIGQRRAVLYGGIIIACGHFTLAIQSLPTFYLGLVLIVARHRPAQGQHQRDRRQALPAAGRAPRRRLLDLLHGHQSRRASSRRWSADILGQRVNWHSGFAAAGVGMTLGVVQYLGRRQYLGDAGLHPAPPPRRRRRPRCDAGDARRRRRRSSC